MTVSQSNLTVKIHKINRKFLILIIGLSALLFAVTLTPKIQEFFGINRAHTQQKIVALSYDDGPNPPYTNQLLDVLARDKIKATFYEIGLNIEKHPDIVRLIVAKGNELANHSYSHQSMVFRSPEFYRAEIEKTDSLLRELNVTQDISFRPPWGRRLLLLPYILSRMGKKLVLWDVDSEDYVKELSAEGIANRVTQQVRPGSIVLLHDGGGDRSRTVAATKIIIKSLKSKGYEFLTVSQLLSRGR
ncbi:MAG: polysaccharide deacetylase family protein [Oscillatoria sp. Prado101]|nr:polysaccharide deacetylase family protein [Oscillatoria sp. Prado101]